jgi:hypothetical protein
LLNVDLSTVEGIENALFDKNTVVEGAKFPDGFDPESAGAVILDSDESVERIIRWEDKRESRIKLRRLKGQAKWGHGCPVPKCYLHNIDE